MGCLTREAKKTWIPSPLQSSDLCTMHYRQAYIGKMEEEELLLYITRDQNYDKYLYDQNFNYREINKIFNSSCTSCLYGAGRIDFDAGKFISRAIGRDGP